jgi:hypothetical protein
MSKDQQFVQRSSASFERPFPTSQPIPVKQLRGNVIRAGLEAPYFTGARCGTLSGGSTWLSECRFPQSADPGFIVLAENLVEAGLPVAPGKNPCIA